MNKILGIINIIILILGIVCVIAGLWIGIYYVVDYSQLHKGGVHFESQFQQASSTIATESKIEDLGTFLGGTVGLLFSLASVLFFTFSLFQSRLELALNREEMALTRGEMAQARSLTENQIAQSTYFNLLKHQKDLYNSTADFSNSINGMQTSVRTFVTYVNQKQFSDFSQTQLSPLTVYNNDDRLRIMAESILNVANFIFEDMGNDEFFHRTFFLSLGELEKYLVGAILENNLSNGLERDYSFDYRQTYIQTSPFRNMFDSRFFPATHFSGFTFSSLYIAATANPEEQKAEIEEKTQFMVMPIENEGLILEKIYYTYSYVLKGSAAIVQDRGFIEPSPSEKFEANLYTLINKVWVDLPQVVDQINVEFNFSFTYKNDSYTVGWLKATILTREHLHRGDHTKELVAKFPTKTLYELIIKPA